MEIILDPLLITKGIDRNTPLSILEYIGNILFIEFNKKYIHIEEYFYELKCKIETSIKEKINYPCTSVDEMEKVLIFLNSSEEWTEKNINEALDSLLPFFQEEVLPIQTSIFGEKTNNSPHSLNPMQIYRLCKEIKYPLNINTTLEEMVFALDKTYNDNLEGLKLSFLEKIKNIDSTSLIKLLHTSFELEGLSNINLKQVKKVKKFVQVDFNSEFLKCMTDSQYLIKRISPKTHEEAIFVSYERWNIFIAESSNPLFQYKILSKNERERVSYIPINDGDFAFKYSMNEEWYNTNKNWFEILVQFYSRQKLIQFCQKEGYTDCKKTSEKTLRCFLIDRQVFCNFYFEIVPYSEEFVSYINRESISEMENIISVGKISDRNMVYFTVEELNDYFTHEKLLIDPISRELFDNYAITKLKTFCKTKNGEHNYYKYKKLLETISMIESCIHIINMNMKNIKDYSLQDPIFSDMLKLSLEKLIELGLTMRGSKNKNVIPLSSFDSKNPIETEALIFQQSFEIYKEYLNLLFDERIKNFMDNINIITFTENGLKYDFFGITIKTSTVNYRRTLRECLEQSFFGNQEDELSCIRTNSNWILYTACWYYHMFSFELKINVSEIEEIL